jgi:(S)-2-hydroxyglutarate dehydrogenase
LLNGLTLSKVVSSMQSPDFLIIGGGIIGVSVARELKRRFQKQSVVVLEKERALGMHSSGRNSGVLHAGFYYTADSLKARFTREGNVALTRFCEEHRLPLNRCGKLVVARSASDLTQLDELLRRARHNHVPMESVTEDEARKIEPRVKTHERALFSPTTSTADPIRVLETMRTEAEKEGVQFKLGECVVTHPKRLVQTQTGVLSAGYIINAAGLHADTIARSFGFSEQYRIVPFKGLYLYGDEPLGAFKTNIYPVPDLRNPFLGVHFTLTVDGHAKIGPTAIPAFWREQYEGLKNFDAVDCAETLLRELGLFFLAGFDFRRLAVEEIFKYNRRHLVHLAGKLATNVSPDNYKRWGRPGIRAQLMDTKTRKLEMDFVLQGDAHSFHILNAVSPGWTCSIPFAAHVCDRISSLLKTG